MDIWTKLSQIDLDNKEYYSKVYADIVRKVQNEEFAIKVGELEKENYYLVTEQNRKNSYFIHIIPKKVWALFKEMQQKAPNEFLGFSVNAGKHNEKEVRISCFGIKCDVLGKALFNKK